MKKLVGPIYSSGSLVDERKHHFTDGYVAPISREKREEQVKLVNKYFNKEKKTTDNLQKKIIDKAEKLQNSFSQEVVKISREEALKLGEARRIEALQRREQYLRTQVIFIILSQGTHAYILIFRWLHRMLPQSSISPLPMLSINPSVNIMKKLMSM